MTYAIPTEVHEPLLIHGDALEKLRGLPACSVDVCIADQPSGLSFMSKPWDSFAGYVPRTERGREVDAQLGGGDLLARAAAFLDGLAGVDGEASGARALGLAEELRAAAGARALMPPWARGFVVFATDMWSEVFRVLKPGAFACVWALPKTADLAGLALRAADFETRDGRQSRKWVEVHESVLHLFGGGMNKAGDIGKQIDKMHGADREVVGSRRGKCIGTASTHAGDAWSREHQHQHDVQLTAPATDDAARWTGWHSQVAPGHEQWLIARKPTRLTYARQLLEHGTGAFNVGACMVPRGEADRDRATAAVTQGSGLGRGTCYGDAHPEHTKYSMSPTGSHPRNVVLTTGGDGCPARGLDRQSGVHGTGDPGCTALAGDSGGASRFFTRFDHRVGYHPKASRRTIAGRPNLRNEHPTHKSPALMRWLVRLMAATAEHTGDKPAVVLDWCMGSGTTGVACLELGVRFIGIERDPGSVTTITTAPSSQHTTGAPRLGSCCSRGRTRAQAKRSRRRKGLAPAPSRPGCTVVVPDEPNSFEVARSRIHAAIGSPEEAAAVNELAAAGDQLELM